MIRITFFILCFVWFFSACEKPPIYDDRPTISWNQFSTDTVDQYAGTVTFNFQFTDGDGDLGSDFDTIQDIIIVDTRRTPNDTFFYKLPVIEPDGNITGISGNVEVDVSLLCCISPSNPLIVCQPIPNFYDTVRYKIRIRDQAGNWSNEIETTTLNIRCQ